MKKEKNRPTLIKILCILGFIGVPIMIGSAFFLEPLWYVLFNIVLAVLYLMSLIFIWKMRKIGLIFYTLLIFIEYAIMFAIGVREYLYLIISLIVLALFYTQLKKMN